MSFDWNEFLKVARGLAGEENAAIPSEEAKWRTVINRAYYAAFNQARWHLRYKDYDRNIPQDGSGHEYVKSRFRSHPDEDYKKIGWELNRLHTARKRADYDDRNADFSIEARLAIKSAGTIISMLEKL
jgi:uncharacterized protein (UPF0332 family)